MEAMCVCKKKKKKFSQKTAEKVLASVFYHKNSEE